MQTRVRKRSRKMILTVGPVLGMIKLVIKYSDFIN